ncbi:MAG: hypothetical protein KC592_13860 [Nitrospira sp.]|nr:hypothetical protein [Nitrospira sp.]
MVNKKLEMTRRHFLLAATAIGAFSWLSCAHLITRFRIPGKTMPSATIKQHLLELFSDQDAPRLLGKRYLDLYPHHRTHPFLLAKRIQSVQPQTSMALKKMLTRQCESDFHSGKTVIIDGWLLAQTEVEACALTVILEV